MSSPIIKNRESLLILFLSLHEPPTRHKLPPPHFNKPKLPPKPEIRRNSGPGSTGSSSPDVLKQQSRGRKTIVEIKANPETDLIRELIFIFQGIEGKILRRDSKTDSFRIVPGELGKFPPPVVKLVLRLGELGWLYHKVHSFTLEKEEEKNIGLIGQSFVAALKDELTEYYRLLYLLGNYFLLFCVGLFYGYFQFYGCFTGNYP